MSQGLTLSAGTVRAIELLSPVHEEVLPRYPMRTGQPIPSIEQFDRNVLELLEALCAAPSRARSARAFVPY